MAKTCPGHDLLVGHRESGETDPLPFPLDLLRDHWDRERRL
jgi:hypothetical protein